MKARSLVLASALFLVTAPALAQAPSADARARAKEAYDRGVEAHGKGDMQRAAQEFARADSLAPSAVALQAALDDAIEADDPALGSELLERSAREKPTGALAASINQGRAKFAGRAGKVKVSCPAGSQCLATIDGAAMETSKPVWARTGQHTIVVQVDGDPQTKLVRVEANQTVDVPGTKKDGASGAAATKDTPPIEPQPSEHKKSRFEDGLPPIFFYGGVGLTVVLAAATTYFAIDTSNKHDDFTNQGCDKANLTNCEKLKSDGESAQTATNIGLVLTGLSAVGTALVGAVFTDWKSPMFGVAPLPGGGAATYARSF